MLATSLLSSPNEEVAKPVPIVPRSWVSSAAAARSHRSRSRCVGVHAVEHHCGRQQASNLRFQTGPRPIGDEDLPIASIRLRALRKQFVASDPVSLRTESRQA